MLSGIDETCREDISYTATIASQTATATWFHSLHVYLQVKQWQGEGEKKSIEGWKEIQRKWKIACRSGFAACFRHSSLNNQMKLFTYLQHHDVHLSQKQYAASVI